MKFFKIFLTISSLFFFLISIPAKAWPSSGEPRIIMGFYSGGLFPGDKAILDFGMVAGMLIQDQLEIDFHLGFLASEIFSQISTPEFLLGISYAGIYTGYRIHLSRLFALVPGISLGLGRSLLQSTDPIGIILSPSLRADFYLKLHEGKTLDFSLYGKYFYYHTQPDLSIPLKGFSIGLEYHLNATLALRR